MDTRLQLLRDWLHEQGYHDFEIAPASADASFRRYFRVRHQGHSFIIMDAPPEQEDTGPFIRVARLMEQAGLHVPHIQATNIEQGFLQLSDLGSQMYLPVLRPDTVETYYQDAMAALLALQRHQTDQLPPYDHALLLREMALFPDWYLGRHLQVSLTTTQSAVLQHSFELLAESALQQPQVIVHRDYHSRNLMVSDPNPGIVDFQDAVIGAVTYDLVSLLRDCYIAWPRQQVENWVRQYHARASQAGIIHNVSFAQFLRWFDWMGIQRHLKATGIFARLYYRDGKPGYLPEIPRTMQYIFDVAADYPELAEFVQLLQDLDLPRRVQDTTPRSVA